MENMLGDVTEKIRTLIVEETTSENNTSLGYDQILNLVAESCEQLSGDLVLQILSKLPVESLLRFKTVCSPWKLLIKSPVFIDIHLNRKNPQIAVFNSGTAGPSQENQSKKPRLLPFRGFVFVGVCNGIFCLKPGHVKKCLFLWNPSTREFSYLPVEREARSCGFFYLSETQQYQVVGFRHSKRDDRNVDILIWTLGKTISMRVIKDVTVPGRIRSRSLVTCGTTMVWLSVDYDEHSNIVVCYDVIGERFSKMDVPPSSSSQELKRCLKVLKYSVIMFVYTKIEPTFFDIWIIVDDVSKGKSWRKYRKVGPLETGMIMKPIDVGNDRWILCSKEVDHNPLFLYDLETDQVEELERKRLRTSGLHSCVESLVSINSLVPSIITSDKSLM